MTGRRAPRALANDPFIWVMLALFVLCNGCVLWIFTTIWARVEMSDLMSQTFAVKLMQVTLGMAIGLAVTFLGVVVTWFGMTEAVSLELGTESAKGALSAVGPGALLVVCGTLLIWVCIQREFVIEDHRPISSMDAKTQKAYDQKSG